MKAFCRGAVATSTSRLPPAFRFLPSKICRFSCHLKNGQRSVTDALFRNVRRLSPSPGSGLSRGGVTITEVGTLMFRVAFSLLEDFLALQMVPLDTGAIQGV